MLWAIAGILMMMWLLGLVAGYTLSSFIHVLLVLAIIIVLIRIDDSGEKARISPSQIDEQLMKKRSMRTNMVEEQYEIAYCG